MDKIRYRTGLSLQIEVVSISNTVRLKPDLVTSQGISLGLYKNGEVSLKVGDTLSMLGITLRLVGVVGDESEAELILEVEKKEDSDVPF